MIFTLLSIFSQRLQSIVLTYLDIRVLFLEGGEILQ